MTGNYIFHLFWIAPLALLIMYLGSPGHLGTQALQRLRKLLENSLERRRYTQFENLHLSVGGGITAFDYLVVCASGIYVIDALHLPGHVSGSKVQVVWRRKHWGRQFTLDNPVHQNYLKMQALQQALGLNIANFHPVVAISGQASIDTDASHVVMDVNAVSRFIRSQTRQILSPDQISQILLQVQKLHLNAPFWNRKTRWKLLRAILLVVLLLASWQIFQQPLTAAYKQFSMAIDRAMSPEEFRADGKKKTEREKWEDQLICSFSIDTNRCACYQPDGEKVAIEAARCRQLSEKGSVLKQ